jgi:hypothetical protein
VRWCANRTEAFVSDTQGRDHDTEATLALDADGASAAPPAVMNAILDALRHCPGAERLQMPARGGNIWALLAQRR